MVKIYLLGQTKDDRDYTWRFAGSFLCRRQSANWPAFAASKSAKPAKVKDGKNPYIDGKNPYILTLFSIFSIVMFAM